MTVCFGCAGGHQLGADFGQGAAAPDEAGGEVGGVGVGAEVADLAGFGQGDAGFFKGVEASVEQEGRDVIAHAVGGGLGGELGGESGARG